MASKAGQLRVINSRGWACLLGAPEVAFGVPEAHMIAWRKGIWCRGYRKAACALLAGHLVHPVVCMMQHEAVTDDCVVAVHVSRLYHQAAPAAPDPAPLPLPPLPPLRHAPRWWCHRLPQRVCRHPAVSHPAREGR